LDPAGNTITELEGEKDLWIAVSDEVTAEWIAEIDAKPRDGAALVQCADAFIAQSGN